jgi:hypothetical protein
MRDASLDRLYRLLPGHLLALDATEGRPLQALMQIFARELEIVEGDAEALYDNWFIETCEDWAATYLGDLVGARALRPFGKGSLRAYVANTLSYRQAKGTLAVVEQLARDVTGWPCVGAEMLQRLIQSQNVNHVRPRNHATMSLRDADLASLVHGPFEQAAHTVDVGNIGLGEGRYNIPNIGLYVWRIQSNAMLFVQDGPAGYRGGVMPRQSAIGPGFRLFDPIGRTKRLFNRPRTENGLAERGTEATMPGPLRLRPLAKDLNDLRAGRAGAGRYFLTRPVVQVRLDGAQVALADLHCCNLEDRDDGLGGIVWNRPATPGHVMFDPVLGRLSLNPADEAKAVEVAFAYGTPHDIGSGPYDRRDQVATWLADFKGGAGDPPPWQVGVTRRSQEVTNNPNQGGPVVATLAAAIQAWNQQAVAGTRGIITILDSATYAENLETPSRLINLPAGARLAIVAAGWPVTPGSGGTKTRKPAQLTPQDRCPHIASNLLVKGTAAGVGDAGVLILDGLLIEGVVRVQAGDLGRLEIRHCTLGAGAMAMGPGLIVAGGAAGDNTRLNLCIDHSITGSVDAGLAAGRVCICDSILGEARVADGDPLNAPVVLAAAAADLVIGRSTLFGKTTGRTLEADDSIFVGPLHIARRQGGCLRFCYLPETSRVPRRYRCTPDLQIAQTKETLGRAFTSADELTIRERIRPMFTSTLAEHHAFGQLSRRCPPEIAEGAEGGAEMGAMNALKDPMRLANVRDALDEYLPFGLTAGVIFIT